MNSPMRLDNGFAIIITQREFFRFQVLVLVILHPNLETPRSDFDRLTELSKIVLINNNVEVTKYAQVQQPPEKVSKTSKPSASAYGSASSDRPYCCPYEGCDKAYIHEYKLNLHLRREHPGHLSDENTKNTQSAIDNDMDEGSDQDAYAAKRGNSSKMQKQSKPKPNLKLPPSKVARKGSTASPANLNVVKKAWPVKEEVYEEEEDSEETEEDRDNVEDGWRYAENNEDDDEETE
ncbi:hypothetical protein ACSBR2_018680 [Camellia fascicularis]